VEKGEMKMMLHIVATLIYVMASAQNGVHAADFLFVQTATGATLNGTLTLTGVADMTIYFADRPVRVAGRTSTEDFLTLFEPSGTFSEDPPNAALECEVDGMATTTIVTITMPALSTTNDGMMTLTYEANVVGITRGGPTPFNLTSAAEDIRVEEVLVCDDTNEVSLYIDSVGTTSGCASPMVSSLSAEGFGALTPPPGSCFAVNGAACASGYDSFQHGPSDIDLNLGTPYLSICIPS